MKTQIHKATADQLGILPDKDGFYFTAENKKISIRDHNAIIAKMQVEIRTYYLSMIEREVERVSNIKL